MKPCKCGSILFYEDFPVSGWWTHTSILKDGALEVQDSTTDNLVIKENAKPRVRCADCGRRVRKSKSTS